MSRTVVPITPPRPSPLLSPTAYWNKQGADRWRRNAHHLEAALAPFSKDIIGHLGPDPDARIVDIGCGTGDLTVELSRFLPKGQAIGLDISLPLLEVALSRPEARTSLSVGFASGDAGRWQPDKKFDGAVSRFGVMFFEDPVASFGNIRNMLKPGGKLVFASWAGMAENEWVMAPFRAMLDYIGSGQPSEPPLPPADVPGPFSLASAERTRSILARSGWTQIELHPWIGHLAFEYMRSLDDLVDFMTGIGGVARLLEAGMVDAPEARHVLTKFLAPIWEDGTATTWRAQAWIVTAIAPEA